jgi:hypothetical protein
MAISKGLISAYSVEKLGFWRRTRRCRVIGLPML